MILDKKITQWIAIILMSLMWGSSFILIKKGLLAYTPAQSAALRICFAFMFFLPIAIKRIKTLNKKNFILFFTVGMIGNFLPAFMFAFGESQIPSSLASMLNSTTPIFVLLIGIIFFHTKAKLINIVGLIIGFIGTLALVSKNPSSLSNWNIGAFVILIASLLYGINTNFIKTQLKQIDSLSIPAFAFFFIGPLAIIYLLSTNLHSTIHNPNFWLSTASIATLAFISSFLALIIFNLVIKHTSAIFASTPTYLMPIIGIMWGLIDHEKISIQQIFAITIILTGVSLVNKNKTIIKKTQIKTQQ